MILHESVTSESATSFSDFIRSIATDPAHKDTFEKCFRFYVPNSRSYDDASIRISTYSIYSPVYASPCDMLGYDKPTAIVKPDRTKYDRTNRTIEITDKHVEKFRKLYETFKENYASYKAQRVEKEAFASFLKSNGIEGAGNVLHRGRYGVFAKTDGTIGIAYEPPYLHKACDPLELSKGFAEDARLLAIAKAKYEGKTYRPN